MLEISEVEIKQSKGKNLVTERASGQQVYPPTNLPLSVISHYPLTKKACREWIKENCIFPEDKILTRNTLEKLTRTDPGKKVRGLEIIQNDVTYQGNMHTEFVLIFKQKDGYYSFPWYDYYCCICIGKWMSHDP